MSSPLPFKDICELKTIQNLTTGIKSIFFTETLLSCVVRSMVDESGQFIKCIHIETMLLKV